MITSLIIWHTQFHMQECQHGTFAAVCYIMSPKVLGTRVRLYCQYYCFYCVPCPSYLHLVEHWKFRNVKIEIIAMVHLCDMVTSLKFSHHWIWKPLTDITYIIFFLLEVLNIYAIIQSQTFVLFVSSCPNQTREVNAYFIGFTVSEGSLKNCSMNFLSVSILRATSLEVVIFFVNLKK